MTLSQGVIIGLPIALVLMGASCVLARYAYCWQPDSYDLGMFATSVKRACYCTPAIVAGFTLAAFYPYHAEYHEWRTHDGVVSSISNRFLATDSGGTSQKFVVTFAGSPQQYACNDTRCASVNVGDSLTLSCKRAWQYSGTDGYDCNFVTMEDHTS